MGVNITGLKDDSQPNWEERAKALCKPENFFSDIWALEPLDCLSDREKELLKLRLTLVTRYAALMACGMLKGVLKYASDIEADNEHNSVESWMSYLLGESADLSNYHALLLNAFEHSQK